MRFQATIDTDNAAFTDDPVNEVERVLNYGLGAMKVRYQGGVDDGPLRDTNGNTVGEWRFDDPVPLPEGAHASRFEGAVCAGCADPECSSELYVHAGCHPESRTWTVLREGGRVADVECATCHKLVVRLVLAP